MWQEHVGGVGRAPRLLAAAAARVAGLLEISGLAALVEDSALTRSQVDAALRYRAAYHDEVAARIELHQRETSAAEKH